MPRIDFHSQVADKLNYTCRLLRKARAANCKITVYGDDDQELKRLDIQLWEISPSDFLPHAFAQDPDAEKSPIILTRTLNGQIPHRQILINLSREVPSNYHTFERVIEIVSSAEVDAQAGRQRFRYYQQEGIQPSHTVAKSS